MKTAVIYHYFEASDVYKDNLIFFLNTAIDNDIDYFIYISEKCTVDLPAFPNVEYIFIENKNYDLGAVVNFNRHEKSNNYSYYIYLNCSVRGPFLPTYATEKWHEVFTSKLSNDIGIVGSTINILPEHSKDSKYFSQKLGSSGPHTHVQTSSFAISSASYKLLKSERFFDENEKLDRLDVILRLEITLSHIILKNGFKICSLLPAYNEFSSTIRSLEYPNTLKNGDPLRKSAFYGRTLVPYETVFIKTNRDMLTKRDLASYTFTSLDSYTKNKMLTSDGLELFKKSSKECTQQYSFLEKVIFKLTKKLF